MQKSSDTPLIDWAENGTKQLVHSYLVKLLAGYGISISNPLVMAVSYPIIKFIIKPLFKDYRDYVILHRLEVESGKNSETLHEAQSDSDFNDALSKL